MNKEQPLKAQSVNIENEEKTNKVERLKGWFKDNKKTIVKRTIIAGGSVIGLAAVIHWLNNKGTDYDESTYVDGPDLEEIDMEVGSSDTNDDEADSDDEFAID